MFYLFFLVFSSYSSLLFNFYLFISSYSSLHISSYSSCIIFFLFVFFYSFSYYSSLLNFYLFISSSSSFLCLTLNELRGTLKKYNVPAAHRSFAVPSGEKYIEKTPRKFQFGKKSAKVYHCLYSSTVQLQVAL